MLKSLNTGALVEPLTGRLWSPQVVRRQLAARTGFYESEGLSVGDRVFLHFGNNNEFFVELLAIWAAGGCAVPVDPRFTDFEIGQLAAWAEPRFSVWMDLPGSELAGNLAALSVRVVHRADGDAMGERGSERESPPGTPESDSVTPGIARDESDDALILFTSGTTGDPKGVVHTFGSLGARWSALREHLGTEAFARTLCPLPTHFGHGLICNSLFPWLSGCDLFLLPPFQPAISARLGQIIDENRITAMSSVPALWRMVTRLASPPRGGTLRRVLIGSAPLSAALWNAVREWSSADEVINAYGITETGSWLAGSTMKEFEVADGLVGKVWGGEIKVLASSSVDAPLLNGQECAVGESGYIWIRTAAIMRGYLKRDDLTGVVKSKGWFLTGDIGVIDSRGWLFLRGRERDEVNKGGMKVYPSDIDVVLERFAGTRDVCAFPFSDPLLGEDIGVAIVLDDPSPAGVAAAATWARKSLATHQMPRRWYIVEEIPRTDRGKVNRTSVAESCAQLTPVPLVAGAGR